MGGSADGVSDAFDEACEKPKFGKGEFFIIDRRIWAALCGLEDMNAAATYLVLVQGSDRSNKHTKWSAESVKKYVGVGHERAKGAIACLINNHFIRYGENHTPARPRYDVLTYSERSRAKGQRKSATLPGDDAIAYNLIWLPNTIVTGTEEREDSPIRRLRAAGDLNALRLFVDLYHAQNLVDDGGVNRQVLWRSCERRKIAERGAYVVYAFKYESRSLGWIGPMEMHRKFEQPIGERQPIWDCIDLLERMRLIAFIPYLIENGTSQAEILHPVGVGIFGEHAIEREIGDAAKAAALVMIFKPTVENAVMDGFTIFCPVLNIYPQAQMVGIARLLYRPHTRRTAAWYAELHEKSRRYIEKFRELAAESKSKNYNDEDW